MPIRLPDPPAQYDRSWGNQYTRVLEADAQTQASQIQTLAMFIAPSYTTVERITLTDMRGQIVFDTDLGKLCVNTGAGWEVITSA